MSRWVSILGAGTIKVSENLTMTTTEQGTSIVSPSNANDLNGTVRFRVTSLPQTSPKLIGLEVDFSSLSAEVDGVAIFAAGDEIFKNRAFRKRGPFVLDVSTARDHAIQPEKGIAVTIYVTFGSAGSNITLDSVGLKILYGKTSQVHTLGTSADVRFQAMLTSPKRQLRLIHLAFLRRSCSGYRTVS
ncbi:hypothetical protein F5B18DRAFT_409888 [Nemania serpens]|nr:hypothetical protein F5B18DRAFT_409888 [Nemania serpens]